MKNVYLVNELDSSYNEFGSSTVLVCTTNEIAQQYISKRRLLDAAKRMARISANDLMAEEMMFDYNFEEKPKFDHSRSSDKIYIKQHENLVEEWKKRKKEDENNALILQQKKQQYYNNLYKKTLSEIDMNSVDMNMCCVHFEIKQMCIVDDESLAIEMAVTDSEM
jgi:predicted nicotinamide N-methyase